MNESLWGQVDSYFENLFIAPDSGFSEIVSTSIARGLPEIQVSPCQGKLLHLIAKLQRPTHILEIGTLGGYSTAWLASALPPGGKLVSLELNQAHAEVALENLARLGLAQAVEIKIGDARRSLSDLHRANSEPFDLIFLDADKTQYSEYFDWSLKLSRPQTVIIADNVVRDGEVIDEQSADAMVQGVRLFNQRVAACPQVQATAVQTVGNKGYDGFAFIVVEEPSV